MKYVLAFCLLIGSALAVGCGAPQPTSVLDNVKKDKITEYEEMVMADAAAMNAEMKTTAKKGEAKTTEPAKTAEPAKAAK